jgi:serine/threonine protein phosphatase PrpC
MLFEHRAFWLAKDVQNPEAYEDAFQVDSQRGLAAVCDGVASTIFSGRWAQILVKLVIAQPPNVNDRGALEVWLRQAREAWSQSIDDTALAWHQKPKMLDGAAATLQWIQIASAPSPDAIPRPYRMWSFSVGDCCLFHVRANQVLQTFPFQDSSHFEEHPQVIRSVFKRDDVVAFQAMETECHPGDLVVLCTDAIAAWTMRQMEAGVSLDWQAYWQMTAQQWQQWVLQLRQQNQIRFDDSTLVLLRVGGPTAARQAVSQSEDSLLDSAETKLRGAFKSLKTSLRRGLRDISESKWLNDDEAK